MATIKATINNAVGMQDRTALLVQWAGVTNADTFAPLSMLPEYTNKSIHVTGTFNGATVVLNGSNSGTEYIGLQDVEGAAISMTSAGLVQVQENPLYYQPAASGGGGSQSLTVSMLFVKSSPAR